MLSNRRRNLEVGVSKELLVRTEQVKLDSSCGGAILYVSDLHLRTSQQELIARELIEIAIKACPEIILLGGDLVESRRALSGLGELTGSLSAIAPVLARSGNHDELVGCSRVRKVILDAGGTWLEDASVLSFDGRVEICANINHRRYLNVPAVLCAHDPAIVRAAAYSGFKLVLAGHLHGGQVVLWQTGERLYPAAFVYRWNGLRFQENGTTLLVSRGVTDTVPIRWNCPREVLLCQF